MVVNPGLVIQYTKLNPIFRKDALEILYTLREKSSCRFKELPGNSFTKAKRVKELRTIKVIEPVMINKSSSERTILAYKLTEKGLSLLSQLDSLFRIIS